MENDSNLNIDKAVSATLTSLLVIGLLSTAAAQDSQNDLEVNVSISDETIIDIQPSKFSWGYGSNSVFPGTEAGPGLEANGYGRIQIENLGSVNISEVWFNNTQPTQKPFGTGDSNIYDSANFLGLDRNSTGTDSNAFIERKEFGLDQPGGEDIIYVSSPSGWDYGRFRNTSQEYFWTVNDTGTSLNGEKFRIGIDHHNETQTGSTSLNGECTGGEGTGGLSCNSYNLNVVTGPGGTDWAVTEVEVGVEDATLASNDGGTEYCVAMQESQVLGTNDPEVNFIKWNKGHPAVQGAGAGSDCDYATNYTIGGSSPAGRLVPGEWITMNLRAKVPYGVVSGNLPTGNLYVLANSQ